MSRKHNDKSSHIILLFKNLGLYKENCVKTVNFQYDTCISDKINIVLISYKIQSSPVDCQNTENSQWDQKP